jgi:hypothetical protein
MGGKNYTNGEILKIRDFLYKIAHLELELIKDLEKRGKLDDFIKELKADKRRKDYKRKKSKKATPPK